MGQGITDASSFSFDNVTLRDPRRHAWAFRLIRLMAWRMQPTLELATTAAESAQQDAEALRAELEALRAELEALRAELEVERRAWEDAAAAEIGLLRQRVALLEHEAADAALAADAGRIKGDWISIGRRRSEPYPKGTRLRVLWRIHTVGPFPRLRSCVVRYAVRAACRFWPLVRNLESASSGLHARAGWRKDRRAMVGRHDRRNTEESAQKDALCSERLAVALRKRPKRVPRLAHVCMMHAF